jgi:hypothetical protein
MSYTADVRKALMRLGKNGTENPDSKHNVGRMLGEAFLWAEVKHYAEARYAHAMDVLTKEGIAPLKNLVEPGEVEFARSPTFVATVKATQPVKRFNPDTLAAIMKASKYKVPEPFMKQMIDNAKVATTSMVTYKIVEKSDA